MVSYEHELWDKYWVCSRGGKRHASLAKGEYSTQFQDEISSFLRREIVLYASAVSKGMEGPRSPRVKR